MTREEYINNYIDRSLKHKRLVGDLMFYIFQHKNTISFQFDEWELLKRAVQHDNDKFTREYMENMADYWLFKDKLTPQEKEHLNQTYINHKKYNNHHPLYFETHNKALTNEDICEMACDFVSSARKNNNAIVEHADTWKNNFEEQNSKLLQPYKEKFFEIFDLFNNYFEKQ